MTKIEYEVIQEMHNDLSGYIDEIKSVGTFEQVEDAIKRAKELEINTKKLKGYTITTKVIVNYE